ncbi:uncharacterized protein N7511_003918 [Penicillium nucicola]|uniref:uncharacterized protein n=1 Tax=Penicillium nucicola TaxID=1850975 RepID=UPI002544E77A|nr:uncharacterized protein N7511_003918 [Penicillium nucicola]KAJ5766302.1 hypothetical protein N7511_003918 [Penicillium nucicola]
MILSFAILTAVLAFGLRQSPLFSTQPHCRCQPGSACWPSQASWNYLNTSIGGNLVALRPAGSVCFKDEFTPDACEDFVKNFHNTNWRVQSPASLQVVNWENLRSREESCHVSPDGNITQCDQGRVARYSAKVESVSQVQAVIEFAAANDLRLAIRNTGHDLAGRSTAADSIQIHTAGLKGIQHTESFHPSAPWGQVVESEGPAVTVGAGVMTGELYSAAAEGKYTVVGGSCSTVGIAGGWMQGGGYGILSPSKGLGVDNVLELNIITAKGSYVTANRYQNQDLFWAVRGGGGGTFGVITSVTFRTFPDVPATIAKLNVISPNGPDEPFWNAVQGHLGGLTALIDQGIATQSFAIPSFPLGGALLTSEIYFINQTDDAGSLLVQDFVKQVKDLGLHVDYSEEHFDQLSTYQAIPKGLEQAGVGIMTASRLVSRDLIASLDGPATMARTLSRLHFNTGDALSFEGIAGGKITGTNKSIESAVHSDWRSAIMSLTLARALPLEPNWETYRTVESEINDIQLPLLESLEQGERGGYLGIPFAHERQPTHTFWGSKYIRLLETKRRWDPSDLFVTRLGVGSEDWDEEGMCRIASSNLMETLLSWFRESCGSLTGVL